MPIEIVVHRKVVLKPFFADEASLGQHTIESRHVVPLGE
jgi:hypothetical protein